MCNGNCKCKENEKLYKCQYDKDLKVGQLVLAVPEEGKNVKTRGIEDIRSEIEEYFDKQHEDILLNFNHHEFKQVFIRLNEDYKKEVLEIFDKENG